MGNSIQIFGRTFLRGLETTRDESGAPDWSGFRQFKNVRVGKDQAERRGGMEVVATFPDAGSAKTFLAGDTMTGICLAEVWALDRPKWALDFLFKSNNVSAAGTLFNSSSISVATAGGNWVFKIGTVELETPVLATPSHMALTRDDAGYHLLVEGVEVDSAAYVAPPAPSATLQFGAIEGVLDFFRLRAPGPSAWAARELRLLNPRGRGVLACYRGHEDANLIYWDRSVHEAHCRANDQRTPASRLSAVRHIPVQGMQTYVDENDRRRLMVVAGGEIFDGPYL